MVGDNFPGKVILHWYSGSLRELEIALSFGFYFSVNYNMTQSANGRNIINALPKEKILLETDGPFTSYKGSYFSPILTGLICNEIIKLREKKDEKKISMESLYTNFKSLLSK
jgi:TatD DNase family protein